MSSEVEYEMAPMELDVRGERLSRSNRRYLGSTQETLCRGQADRGHGLPPR